MTNEVDSNMTEVDQFTRHERKEEMKRQFISFGFMIVLTAISFALVATGTITSTYVIPIIFVMAIVQAGFQFYYFMHLKDKGHAMPATLIYGGVWAAFLTLAGLAIISWW